MCINEKKELTCLDSSPLKVHFLNISFISFVGFVRYLKKIRIFK